MLFVKLILLNISWYCSACVVSYFLFGDFDTIFNFKGEFNIVNFLLILSYIIFLLPIAISALKEL